MHRARPRSGRVEGRRSNGDPREKANRGAEDARARRRDADADAAHMTRQRRVARSCLFMRRDASHPHAHVTLHMGGHLHLACGGHGGGTVARHTWTWT